MTILAICTLILIGVMFISTMVKPTQTTLPALERILQFIFLGVPIALACVVLFG